MYITREALTLYRNGWQAALPPSIKTFFTNILFQPSERFILHALTTNNLGETHTLLFCSLRTNLSLFFGSECLFLGSLRRKGNKFKAFCSLVFFVLKAGCNDSAFRKGTQLLICAVEDEVALKNHPKQCWCCPQGGISGVGSVLFCI